MEESPLENIRELRELEDRVEASSALTTTWSSVNAQDCRTRNYGRNHHLHRPCGKSIGQDLRQEMPIRSGNPQERQSQERLRSHWTTLYPCVSSRAQPTYQVRASMRRYSHAYAQSFTIYDRQSGIRSRERPVQQPLALRLHPSVERV